MAITSQTWSNYPFEVNIAGPSDNYTAATYITHLIAWFAANTSQWTVTTSSTNWLEIKPPTGVSAINEDDRILIFGGASPNAAALSSGANASSSQVYICYAPNAGTTGPDVDPTTGDPYTGVISSKLVIGAVAITSYDQMDVYMSNDCICLNLGTDNVSTHNVIGVGFIGRAYNPVDSTDQFTFISGMGEAFDIDWSVNIGQQTGFFNADNTPGSSDTATWCQDSAGDVAWVKIKRTNGWVANGHKNNSTEDRYFFPIHFHRAEAPTTQYMGTVLFAKGGPADSHGNTKVDGGGTRGYSISANDTITTYSTFYLWNE